LVPSPESPGMSQPAKGDESAEDADAEAAGIDPAEAFALLGDDTRIEILQALRDATQERDGAPVPFSELYDRVSVDDSAHFNYHLKRLTDHFVRRADEGYTFRYPGWKVVRSVFAGTFNERASLDPFDAPGDCYACGGPLRAWYADEYLTVECSACGASHVSFPFPPGALDDRSPEELLTAFHHHVRHHYCLAADGVCPECMGRMETALRTDTDADGLAVATRHACRRCDHTLTSAVGLNLLDDAGVLSFHANRGVDLSTRPFWTFDWCVSDERTTVLSTDPVRVRVDVPCDGDVLRLTVDDGLEVLGRERVEGAEA